MWWLAMLAAVLLGGAWQEIGGALVGAAIVWLLMQLARQRQRIDVLAAAVAALERRVALPAPAAVAAAAPEQVDRPAVEPALEQAAAASTDASADTSANTSAPHVLAQNAAPVEARSPAVVADVVDTPGGAPARRRPQPEPPPPQPPRDRLAPLRRWLFGGNTIVKAGVAILFLGLAFLARYATEHVSVPIEWRLASIGGVALVLLLLGWRLRGRRAGYAQVLQGGAVAVLYLTLFVAFRFYGVIALLPAFALMVAVAGLSAALAVLQDARSLAVVGALGGFATPLLVSSGDGPAAALFGYYLVLDLGIAAVAWYRTWRPLNLIGFYGTFGVATAWGVLRYSPAHYAMSQGFLIAYFLVFVAILLMPARRAAPAAGAARSDAWVTGSLLFGLPTITFALQYALVRETAHGVALSALAMSAFYVGLAGLLRRRTALVLPFEASLAIATVFLTLVIPFAFDAHATAGAWALEGAGLVWLGLRPQRRLPRAFGAALLLLSGLWLAGVLADRGPPAQAFSAWLASALMLAAGALAAGCFVQRAAAAGRLGGPEALAEPLSIAWATLWLAIAAAVEIDRFVPADRALAAALAAASVGALLYAGLSVRLRWPRLALPLIGHAPFAALVLLAQLEPFGRAFAGGGAWAWPLALVAHAVVLRWATPAWPAAARHLAHAAGALVLAGVGAAEGRALTAGWSVPAAGGSDAVGDMVGRSISGSISGPVAGSAGAWPWLGWLAVPAAVLGALLRPSVARRWPVSALPVAYVTTAGGVLAAGLWLWTLLANAASDGAAPPLPYVPLLNPLDLGVGVALVAAALWSRRGAPAAPSAMPWLADALLAAAVFVWLNAMLLRGFHHLSGVPYRWVAWADSLKVQTGVTLLWSVTALAVMWWAARRAARWPWMAGAGLLGAVVLKLLLVDLSGSGTVTRIVSFIGVGVLMLVIGYVAPLPAKGGERAAS